MSEAELKNQGYEQIEAPELGADRVHGEFSVMGHQGVMVDLAPKGTFWMDVGEANERDPAQFTPHWLRGYQCGGGKFYRKNVEEKPRALVGIVAVDGFDFIRVARTSGDRARDMSSTEVHVIEKREGWEVLSYRTEDAETCKRFCEDNDFRRFVGYPVIIIKLPKVPDGQ